jgi:hypothetical protein
MTMRGPRGSNLLQGEVITLAALAARTAGANGTAVNIAGERRRFVIVNAITVSATDAADTLDVYVDFSLDSAIWYNAVHFTQRAGNLPATPRTEYAVLDPSNPGTAVINVTADAAAAAVRPALFGPYIRARWAIVDAGGAGDQSHTFSVIAYAV